MSVFGFLTVRTLHQRRVSNTPIKQRDHDLMRMLIAEIVINIFTSIFRFCRTKSFQDVLVYMEFVFVESLFG